VAVLKSITQAKRWFVATPADEDALTFATARSHDQGLVDSFVRCVLLVFAFALPFLHDPGVLDVAADIRATATHICAGTAGILLLTRTAFRSIEVGRARVPLNASLALLLLLFAALTTVFNDHPARALQALKQLAACFVLGLATAAVWNERFSRQMMWALCLPLPFLTMLAAAQTYELTADKLAAALPGALSWVGDLSQWSLHFFQQVYPPATTFANRNLAASWAGMLVPLLVALLVGSRGALVRIGAGCLLTTATILLFLLRSRAPWVSLELAAGALLLLLVVMRQAPQRGAKESRPIRMGVAVAAFLVLAGLTAAFVVLILGGELQRASTSSDPVRWAFNLNGLLMLRDHPIIGVGLGGFYYEYPLYHDAWTPTPQQGGFDIGLRPREIHNDFLQALIELGVGGGLIFAALFVVAIVFAARTGMFYRDWRNLLMGGALLTLAINALLDFPLQFPTAIAIGAILMGGITREFLDRIPNGGFSLRARARPLVSRVLLALLLAGFAVFLADDWRARQGNALVKQAALRLVQQGSDRETLRLVDAAREIYPYDPRIIEFVGIAYANHGDRQVPIDTIAERLEAAVQQDPWGPYLLIALANTYLTIAGLDPPPSSIEPKAALDVAQQIYDTLRRVAHFSPQTDGIGANLAFLRGDFCTSERLYRAVLARLPNDATARTGWAAIQQYRQRDPGAFERCPP